MNRPTAAIAAIVSLLCLMVFAGPTRAAQSYDACVGYIDSLPATISTQGVWCLRKDLSTAIASGKAITVDTNNVTIDCNDYKIGGLGAGMNSYTFGVYANDRLNITVRRCNVRGFYTGLLMSGGSGHLLENNVLDHNLYSGLSMLYSGNSIVRKNRVFDTGGTPGGGASFGIIASADIIDNTVSGVFATASATDSRGIVATGVGTVVSGNRIRDVIAPSGSGGTIAIQVTANAVRVDGNHMYAAPGTSGGTSWGVLGVGVADTFCTNNTVAKLTVPMADCQDAGGNYSN